MTEFITRANYENKNFEIIIKTDSEAHYKLAETFSRALVDDCGYEKAVVHCKDCKYYETEGNYCNRDIVKSLLSTEPTDFCSWAERRENK